MVFLWRLRRRQITKERKCVKALSIKQPFAWLILSGHKDVEYRTWTTTYRGTLLIHASKGSDPEMVKEVYSVHEKAGQKLPELKKGGIIGVANLDDVVFSKKHGVYGWKLSRIRKLKFFACPGKVGLFNVDGRLVGFKTE